MPSQSTHPQRASDHHAVVAHNTPVSRPLAFSEQFHRRHLAHPLRVPKTLTCFSAGNNTIPEIEPHEERAYWRHIGMLDAYRVGQLDVLRPLPRFRPVNPSAR